jgi:hypothetical protein
MWIFRGPDPFFYSGPDPLFTLFSSYLVTFAVIVRLEWSKYQNVSTADDESIGGIGFGDRSVCGRGQAYLRENRGLYYTPRFIRAGTKRLYVKVWKIRLKMENNNRIAG